MNSQDRLNQLIARLKERGHRLTPQRMAVLEILATSDEHPSVEQIYEQVRADFPMTSLATIYKTVALLSEMGEVHEIDVGNIGHRYDGSKPYPHPHLICIKCKNIADVEIAITSELPLEVAQATGYQILSHRLEFFGICPRCQGKKEPKSDEKKGEHYDAQ